jgi:hypothetical protein
MLAEKVGRTECSSGGWLLCSRDSREGQLENLDMLPGDMAALLATCFLHPRCLVRVGETKL